MSAMPDRLVLIVEHDVWLRTSLSRLFEQAGFEVVCASNGFGGLRRAVELRPELVVIGARLPEVSATAVAEELRGVHHFGRMQIVTAEEILRGPRPDELPKDAPVTSRRTPAPGRPSPSVKRKGMIRARSMQLR